MIAIVSLVIEGSYYIPFTAKVFLDGQQAYNAALLEHIYNCLLTVLPVIFKQAVGPGVLQNLINK